MKNITAIQGLKCFCILAGIVSFFYLIGTAGASDLNTITTQQLLSRAIKGTIVLLASFIMCCWLNGQADEN